MKELLFISYAHDNYDKVKLIKKELENNPFFEPLVVADKRKPNSALVKLISEGIDSSYCIIPILSPQSFRTQWINQEIGYAFAQNKPIYPIIESSVFNELKGFIHKQNQCPYIYTLRMGLFLKDENKQFISCFKQLIKDLEDEYKANQHKDKMEVIQKANESILLPLGLDSNRFSSFSLRKPLGTIARSGEKCPETGIWKTSTRPTTSIPFNEGVKMPSYEGKPMIWKLVSYT